MAGALIGVPLAWGIHRSRILGESAEEMDLPIMFATWVVAVILGFGVMSRGGNAESPTGSDRLRQTSNLKPQITSNREGSA